jgi:hypothetical protein
MVIYIADEPVLTPENDINNMIVIQMPVAFDNKKAVKM